MMETIKVGDTDLIVAARIQPTKDGESTFVITVKNGAQYERIQHVNFYEIRNAYNNAGYFGTLLIVLRQGYPEEYPCAILVKDEELTIETRNELIDKLNEADISQWIRKS